ncbi:MAG: LLM class flavin-dependent oxidoreductase [Kineosporiaceae bacterium]
MRIGVVILPDLRWREALPRWREAEARGFDTAWTYDHLSWRSLRDGPWLGAVPLLAAVAAATSTLRIGTLVTSPNYRHPALLAKDVMTLDEVSGGRVDLGLGAGGAGYDADVLGAPRLSPADRAARFEEFTRRPSTCCSGSPPRPTAAGSSPRWSPGRCPGACSARGCRSRWPPPGRGRWRSPPRSGRRG